MSYVNWMKQNKPLEDLWYCYLVDEVVKVLPENLKNAIMHEAQRRSGFRYRGPTRQLRLIDNPAALVSAIVARYDKLLRQSKEDQLELFKAWASERDRATRAEKYFLEFALLFTVLCAGGIISIDLDRLDQVMKTLASTMPSFVPVQAWLLAKARATGKAATLNNQPMPK
jgi:hypothetical protein